MVANDLQWHEQRRCAWCGSTETRFVQRGYAGPTDEVNQYVVCGQCGRVTYDFVAKTAREMRYGHFRVGGVYRDTVHQTRYEISRILKIGANEHLLYLKPLPLTRSPRPKPDATPD